MLRHRVSHLCRLLPLLLIGGCGNAAQSSGSEAPSATRSVRFPTDPFAAADYTPDCVYPRGTFAPESLWHVAYKPFSAWVNLAPWAFWAVSAARPAVLVELGSHNGYSSFAFAQAIDNLGLDTRAYIIDTWEGDAHSGFYDDKIYQAVSERARRHYAKNLTLLRMTFDEGLVHVEDGSVDLLHIDGRHFYEDVKHDFDTWLVKMSPRGVVMFHDIDILDKDFGVHRFWAEQQAIYPSFAFHQGPGLGILGVGKDLPEGFTNLFAARDTPEGACVQHIYEDLGEAAVRWEPVVD